MIAFSSVLLMLVLLLVMSAMFNRYLPGWFCDKLGWHMSGETWAFDGYNVKSACSRCGKRVMRDSQGNWF